MADKKVRVDWSKSALRTMRYRGVPTADNDALSQGMAMVGVPVAFGFLGWVIDSWVGTGWIFAAVFAAFGVACSFASAYYKYERRIAVHEAGKPWMRGDRKEIAR